MLIVMVKLRASLKLSKQKVNLVGELMKLKGLREVVGEADGLEVGVAADGEFVAVADGPTELTEEYSIANQTVARVKVTMNQVLRKGKNPKKIVTQMQAIKTKSLTRKKASPQSMKKLSSKQ